MLRLDDIALFVRTAELGSLSAAARELDCSPAVASAALKRLETQLALRLFERSTRAMRLTEAGQTLLAYAERALDLLNEGVAQADNARGGLTGVIRLAAPQGLAHSVLLPWLDDFLRAHSGVRLHLTVGDRLQDLLRDEIDLALRFGALPDSALVARPLCATARIVCAAPDYLARAGTPTHPDNLARHDCLTYTYSALGNQWQFEDNAGQMVNARIGGPINANNGMLLAEIAAAGGGIALAPCFILQPLIDAGRLQRVLPDWNTPRLPIHAVYPTRRHLSVKVQAMANFLKDWFGAQ